MRKDRRRRVPLAVWCAFTFLAPCSCGREPDLAQAERDLEALVPADTVAVVRVASLAALDRGGAELADLTGEAPHSFDVDELLSQLGHPAGATSLLDRELPVVIALSLPRATPPVPVLIVPTTDPAGYAASIGASSAPPVTHGSYVAVPLGGRYEKPGAPSPLLKRLSNGLVVAHADAQKIVRAFGPVIGMSLSAFKAQVKAEMEQDTPGVDGEALAEVYIDIVRSALQSIEAVDVALDLRDGELRALATLLALPDSAMDGWWSEQPVDLREVARYVRKDSSVMMAGCFDWRSLGDKIQPLLDTVFEAYPEPFRKLVGPLKESYADISSVLGPTYAMDLRFSGDGLSFRTQLRPTDTERFRSLYAELFGALAEHEPGIRAEGPTRSESDGNVIDDYRVSFDFDAIARALGVPDGEAHRRTMEENVDLIAGSDATVSVRFASGSEHAVIAVGELGEGETSGQAAGAAEPPPALTAALARFDGCNPVFVEVYDMRRLLSQLAKPKGGATVTVEGPSAMMMGMGIREREWRIALTLSAAGLPTVDSNGR